LEYRTAFAQYYLDAKKYEEAIDVMIDPKAEGGAEKGLLDLSKTWVNKEVRLSEAALERVLKLNPGNMDAAFDLGQLYYSDGKEKDGRTKELLTKYTEKGQDAGKLENAKNMLIIINRRTK
jgi:thioredoxin-like negative regulator of GroEL